MLHDVAHSVREIHEAGLVHTNINPSNVMWVPSQGEWVVTGVTNVAQRGAQIAPGRADGYSMPHTAPELARLLPLRRGGIGCCSQSDDSCSREWWLEGPLIADASLDCWAIGVLAWELLTGTPAFDLEEEGELEVRTCSHSSAPATRRACTASFLPAVCQHPHTCSVGTERGRRRTPW